MKKASENIVIIDYGMGNLKNVKNAFNKLGYCSKISEDFKDIERATHLVLPGVGGFKDAMSALKKKDLTGPIKYAIGSKTPFLGVCLGMQLLFEKSEEFGEHEGLSILKGKVVKFDENKVPLIPHIGWNNIEIKKGIKKDIKKSIKKDETGGGGDFKPSISEFRNIKNGTFFYFLHSYYCIPEEDIVAATCFYYEEFTACVKKNNIFACQFHPEKSHDGGLTLLKNFVSQ